MNCSICNSNNIRIIYQGKIRDGGLKRYTKQMVNMYQCQDCDVIWHEPILETKEYYESEEYRNSLEGSSEELNFYKLHDKESLDKFQYTGTTIFRNKAVADIGCGCGAFLDYVSGVANQIIAIEPSETYRKIMDKKGFLSYPYACDAMSTWKEKVDVITSFDVIEHVDNPIAFISDVFELLAEGGKAIIGTPTDAPIMRSLLGEIYEQKVLFSTQHIWIFSKENLSRMALNAGFKEENIIIKYYQRYGIQNMIGWVRDKEPRSDIEDAFFANAMDSIWKAECEASGMSDYIVLYLEKPKKK